MPRKKLSPKEQKKSKEKRKAYKLIHQQERRKRMKEVVCPCPSNNYKSLKQRAQRYNRTVGRYLLEFEAAHHHKMRLDPAPKITKAIQRDLLMIRMILEDAEELFPTHPDFIKILSLLEPIHELLNVILNFRSNE